VSEAAIQDKNQQSYFKDKVRMLIQRYIKGDQLDEHIIDGLQKAGLRNLSP
jgi:hypothetical protein